MTTEDRRYLQDVHHEAARARKMKGPQIVEACKKDVGIQKHIVWNWWHGTNCPAFRRIVELCRVVGINFFIERDGKLHKIEFDDTRARKGHWILLGDVVQLDPAIDELDPGHRAAVVALIEHFQKQTASKSFNMAREFDQLNAEQQKTVRMVLNRCKKENEARKKATAGQAKRKAARAA